MDQNIEIASNLESSKLVEALKQKGYLKTKEEIELLSKMAKERECKTETARVFEAGKDMNQVADAPSKGRATGKFFMPIGWGWAYPFVKYTSLFLISTKTFLGVPWLPFFILCGLGVRILLLPLMVKQMVLIQRMAKVTPNIRLLAYCTAKSNLPLGKKVSYFTRALYRYCKDVNVNPFMFAAYNLVQLPVFFLMVFSIRKISFEEDLSSSGLLWFINMNDADKFFILPLMSLGATYFNLGRGINKDNEHWFINRWRSFFIVLQICYFPFTCQWPAGTHIYWITSSILTVLQSKILRHPRVMAKINPTFFIDMEKLTRSERSKEDSERYIEKLKACEDTIIKAPTNDRNVLYELNYEQTRMNTYLQTMRYRNKAKAKYQSFVKKLKAILNKLNFFKRIK